MYIENPKMEIAIAMIRLLVGFLLGIVASPLFLYALLFMDLNIKNTILNAIMLPLALFTLWVKTDEIYKFFINKKHVKFTNRCVLYNEWKADKNDFFLHK